MQKITGDNTAYSRKQILEKFTLQYPANCVRYDLESYIKGHKGIIFQDRMRFASEIT